MGMIEEENGEVRRNEGMKGERLDRGIASLLKVFGLMISLLCKLLKQIKEL